MAIKELKSLTFGNGDTYVPAPTRWEDIPNNPFADAGRNTVSWESCGIDYNSLPKSTWVKMSDAVVTMEDFADFTESDMLISWMQRDSEWANVATDEGRGTSFLGDNGDRIEIPIVDAYGNTYAGVAFCQDGIYFLTGDGSDMEAYPLSVTIPRYGKIEAPEKVDSKSLPEALQVEEISLTDTAKIDSLYDENGILNVDMAAKSTWLSYFRKVTGADIPVSLAGGTTFGWAYDEYGVYHQFDATEINNGFYCVWDTDENGNTIQGGFLATRGCGYDTGLYLDAYYNLEFTSFTAIFETRTPKPIDSNCLPKAEAVPDAAGSTVTAEEFNALLAALRNAGYMAE